jgi:putative endonuclease
MRSKGSAYIVYIIECADGSLYTGITTDLKRRFAEHQKGVGGHYTRSRGVKKLVYNEKQPNRSLASRREAEIKRLTREQKLSLIY